MQFLIFMSVLVITVFVVVLFSKLLNDSYSEKAEQQKIDGIVSQCQWLAGQVVGVDFLIDDSSNSISNQTNELAAGLHGRIIVVKSNYKIVKDTMTDYQDKFYISDELLNVMKGNKKRIVSEVGSNVEIMIPIMNKGNRKKKVLGSVIATIPKSDIVAVSNEMKQQRNMLVVAFIICGMSAGALLSYWLTKDYRKIQKDLDFISSGHEDEMISVVGCTEVKNMVTAMNEILAKAQVLENSRQEFVSNVSHELKTPMTSMKVLADSLLQQGETVPAELYR